MASGLLSPLLSSASKLLDLLRSRPSGSCPLPSGRSTVSADVQRLERLLRRIQATLDDAGEREVRDSSVKLWIEELTDLARDAEDVLDDHRYELLRRQVQERQEAAAAASSATVKRKHDGEDGTISEMLRKITRRFEISTDRAAVQLRPEEDGDTSEQIGEIAQRFEEISTDRAAPQLWPEDEHGGISERIREITCRFEEISRDRAALHLGPEDGERTSGRDSWCRATSHLLDESLVFGRTKEKESIIESVLSFSQGAGTHVLPIVGMGGIGKTTMAQMIYNDNLVQESYALMGWVHVSQTFDLVKLTIAITESLTRKSCNFNELSCVHDVLKKVVNGKCVFLVLDDLWNGWQDLLCPLKFARSLTVLVTTRSKEVARLVQTVGPFVLGSLPDDHCWLLFQHCAFGDRMIHEQCSLVQVGRKIMRKCGGLPLAVKAIGCMLRSKMYMQFWMEILESDFWECSDDNEEMFSALRLSFYRLPARLKPCFLLCALYPKGWQFTKDDMIHLWVAQGYIHPTKCKTPEEVAADYFEELTQRSLIETYVDLTCDYIEVFRRSLMSNDCQYFPQQTDRQDRKIRHTRSFIFNYSLNFAELHRISLLEALGGRTSNSTLNPALSSSQTFWLHDMTWDLAKSLSSHMLSEMPCAGGRLKVANKVQHLFVVQPNGKFEDCNLDNLRTLVFESIGFVADNISIHNFAYLRVLILYCRLFSGSISCIQNLKHLRYLRVYCRVIKRNPELLQSGNTKPELFLGTICNLYSLEKLVIKSCGNTQLCIKSCDLVSLRYLRLSVNSNCFSFLRFCELYNLDTLCLHSCYNITELHICIGNLKKLRRLKLSEIAVIKLNHESFQCQNNNNKCQQLEVTFPALEELEFDRLRALQDWCGLQDSDCPKLQNITIRNCYKLRRMPYFGSVRKLMLSKLALTDLQLSVHSAPSQLQILDIRDCQNLNSLVGLECLCSLGSLYIANCPDLIVPPKMKLPHKPHYIFINECPGLMEWCLVQDFYYQVSEMKVSFIKKAAKEYGRGIAFFKSIQHLYLDTCPEEGLELVLSLDNWLPSEVRLLEVVDLKSFRAVPSSNGGFSVLRRLEIRGCPKLLALVGLEKLDLLSSLVLADCPLLYILPEMKFPPRLTSLVVHGCHKLLSLHLDSNHSTWTELEVSDCQGFMHIGGLEHLINLDSLVLLHCGLLELQELLPVIPDFVCVFLCPKLKKWCEIQSIEYVESLPDSA